MYISRVGFTRISHNFEKLFSLKTDAFHNINVNSVFIVEIVCIFVYSMNKTIGIST